MVTFAAPTFTNLDVGLPGSASNPDDAQSTVLVQPGAVTARAIGFSFPGHIGEYQHTLGAGTQQINWNLVVRARTLAILAAIDGSIRTAQFAGEGTMVDADGVSYARTVLVGHQKGTRAIIRDAERFGWVLRQDVLTFRVLAPS